ncbi:hypothetical protein [Candidatus Methanomethylophilus sp. 1R26]|nr:hypothetical protein [Candidatus Methanomethylophilus sp. 1R26]
MCFLDAGHPGSVSLRATRSPKYPSRTFFSSAEMSVISCGRVTSILFT